MPLALRTFTLAKDPECPDENQDAFRFDAARGVAALADGVSSAIFSRQWAGILATAALDLPDPDDQELFGRWLCEQRQAWSAQIDTGGLAWFQKAKLPQGAFSTLLWIRVAPADGQQPGTFGAFRLQGYAIGDTCLLHVRHGEVLRTFPVLRSAEFEADPVVLGSLDLKHDDLLRFARLDTVCYADDLLVLCTDAIAEWALRSIESGQSPDWERFWDMNQHAWQAEIGRRRQSRDMRYDDATLMLVRVAEHTAETSVQAEPRRDGPIVAEPAEGASGGMVSRRILDGLRRWKDKVLR